MDVSDLSTLGNAVNLKLGTAASLLQGFRPDWDFTDRTAPFFSVAAKPLQELNTELTPATAEWGYPEISLHDSAEDLLGAVLPFDLAASPDDPAAPAIRAGFLLAADKDRPAALASLSRTLGVDLAKADQRYALVQLRRVTGTAWHPCYRNGVFVLPNPSTPDPALGVSEEFRRRMTKLRPEPIDADPAGAGSVLARANDLLTLFGTYGTHFVSKVEAGDRIFQVFAYPSERFKAVRAAYASGENPLSGRRATAFSYYTTPAKSGGQGYVAAYGSILSASGDPALAKSVKDGQWKEPTFAKGPSIFAAFEPSSGLSIDTLDQTFTQVAPIRVELSPLAVFAESSRRPVWRRVFKAAMYQKYRDGVQPRFVKTDERDYKTLIPVEDTGLVSTIATPSINTYKERLNLADLQLVAADQVKDFTLFANCLQHTGGAVADIPGTDVALVAQIMAMAPQGGGGTCAIRLEDAAFDSVQLACQEFHGALLVTNRSASKHFVIVDGLRFTSQDGASGRWDVRAAADIRTAPPPAVLPRIKDSLEFSMVLAEAMISDQGVPRGDAVRTLATSYFAWVANLIPGDTRDVDLLDLRLRALDLGRSAAEPVRGVFVPILPYRQYEKDVQAILSFVTTVNAEISEHQQAIALRKQNELIIDVGKTLNQNIIESGQLLSGVVNANATHMNEMSQFYDSIVETTRSEYDRQAAKVGELERLLTEAKSRTNTEVESYKSAVKGWKEKAWLKFALTLAVDLFKAGASIATGKPDTPGQPDTPDSGNPEDALQSLFELAKQAQNAFEIVNKTTALYAVADQSADLIKSALDSLEKADPISSNPSVLPFDELTLRFSTVMKAGPDDVDRLALEEAFGILILRAKAMIVAKANASRLAREIYLNQRKKSLNKAQADRLNALNGALKPKSIPDLERSKIDLVGLTGKLLFVRKQMLAMLAKSFAMQDHAMQYENLQPATSIESFSLLDVKGAVSRQQTAATRAKERLGRTQTSTTQPIRFEMEGVHAENLIGGREFSFTISPDAHVLLPGPRETGGPTDDWTNPRKSTLGGYATVRLKAAVATIKGLPTSGDGEYKVKLEFVGNPFADRDLDGNPKYFRTVSRSRLYEYFFADNQPKFSDRGESWSEGVSRVTPFSTWSISLPNLPPDQAAKLAGRVLTIRLTFVFEARVLPELALDVRGRGALAAGAAPPVTDLVTAMARQGSVTNGWDVVFNMSLAEINRSLAAQYEALKSNTAYANRIKVEARLYRRRRCEITRFEVEYGPPRLEFLVNNTNSVKLTAQILVGTLQQCDFDGKCEEAKGEPKCDDAISVAGKTLTATVPLDKIEGKVQPQQPGQKTFSVVVDLAKGAFDASEMDLTDEEQVEFNRALKAYFSLHPVQFVLNTLDLSRIATVADLQPSQFRFKNLRTPGGQSMLQLFISTAGRAELGDSQAFLNNTPEPIPEGCDCSLMISSRVFFGGVLPALASGWTLRGNGDARNTAKAWNASYEAGQLAGTVDFSGMNFKVDHSVPDSMDTCVWEYTFNNQQPVSWPVKGMTLEPNNDGIMRMTFESKGELTVTANVFERCTLSGNTPKPPQPYKTEITMSASAQLPTSVSGTGRDQSLKFAVTDKTFPVSGHMSGGGPFGCDDLQAQLNREIAKQFPPQLVNQYNISFTSVSLFALKNLLFPSNNFIVLDKAYVPGDLLVLGKFGTGK